NVNFNGPVYGLTASDFVLGFSSGGQGINGLAGWTKTITTGADGSSSYVLRLRNDDAWSGTVTLSLPAAVATDLAGNPNPASTTITRTMSFVPELSLGTVNGLSGSNPIAIAPNATIKYRGDSYTLPGFRVVIKNFKTGDNLAFTGYTGSHQLVSAVTTSGSDKILEVSNPNGYIPPATLQEAIRLVKWSTTSTDRTARTIEFTIKPNDDFLYETRHFYRLETNAGYFANTNKSYAESQINGRYYGAASGYLPTITSAAENSMVKSKGDNSPLWLGGRNTGADWKWNVGPENGTKFTHEDQICLWLVGCSDNAFATGRSESGRYNNWQKDLFGNNAEPNNTSADIFKSADDISMDKNGFWQDGLGAFANIAIVAEYGNQTVGDSSWDSKVFASQSISFDSTAPTLTLTATPNLVNDKAIFNLTGNESIDCSTLTAADLTTSGIDDTTIVVKQVSPVACEISAAHTLTAGVQGTISVTKAAGFSVKDAAGNAATTLTNGATAVTITATPPAPVSSTQQNTAVSQTTYNLTPPSERTTGFTQPDPAAKAALDTALTAAKIVEPPQTAPEKKGERDISALPGNTRYELSDEITVIQGTKVGADFKVAQGRRNSHEAWGYIRIGNGDWLSLGKQTLMANGQADLASIGQMAFTQVGTYQLKIVVVPVGITMPARVVRGASFRPVVKAPARISSKFTFGRAAVTDAQLAGVGDDSYQLTVNVTPSQTAPNVVVVAPNVTSVEAAPSTGQFKVGDTIDVKVNFSTSVDVTGVPQLRFNFGGQDNFATYTGGSGTNQLTFSFSIQPDDNTSDFDYASSSSLELNGGTIVQTGSSTAAMLGLPTPGSSGSIAFNSAVVVDNVAPKVSLSAVDTSATSATLSFLLNSETPIDCATVSSTSGVDFVFTGISAITNISQTNPTRCTITATSSVAAGQTGTSTLDLAANASFGDSAGNTTISSDLLVTSASVSVAVPAAPAPSSGGSGGGSGSGSGSGGSTGGGTGGGTGGSTGGGAGGTKPGTGGTKPGSGGTKPGSGSGGSSGGSSGSGSSGSGSNSGASGSGSTTGAASSSSASAGQDGSQDSSGGSGSGSGSNSESGDGASESVNAGGENEFADGNPIGASIWAISTAAAVAAFWWFIILAKRRKKKAEAE
ncbi:MAG: hypothetical protein RL167_146, partial [Actinomycetota bacterium]